MDERYEDRHLASDFWMISRVEATRNAVNFSEVFLVHFGAEPNVRYNQDQLLSFFLNCLRHLGLLSLEKQHDMLSTF